MKRRVWPARLLVAGSAIAGTHSAWSESGPYALSVFQTVSYQPNVFQAENGATRTSDLISSTGLAFGVKPTFDNVKLFANGTVQGNIYQDTKDLNNTSYGLSLGAESSGERLAGTIRYSINQTLGNYGTPGVASTTERNLQNTQEATLALRYRMTPRTNLVGGFGYQSLSYSAAAFDGQENSSGTAFVEITHRLNPELTAGGGLRVASGRTPKYSIDPATGGFVADNFDGEYLDLLASWRPGSANTVQARLSLTRVNHSQASQLDFTGVTGIISWTYAASSRLALTASLTQNTGAGPTLSGPVVVGSPSAATTDSGSAGGAASGAPAATGSDPATAAPSGSAAPAAEAASSAGTTSADNNRLNTALNFALNYQLSRTLKLNGNVSFNNAGLVNTSGTKGNAWSSVLGLGIDYLPTRSIALGCSLSTTLQRASDSAQSSGQAYSYRSPSVACTGTFSFF